MKPVISTPKGEIHIRAATPADAVAYRELRLEALQDSPTAFSADYQKNLYEPPRYWQERVTLHPDEAALLLAEHDHKLIGMTGIFRGSAPKTRHAATVWGVYVNPLWRGLHIAEELIKACLDWAKARSIVVAQLGVTAINTPAVHCYQRCGFQICGTEPRALFHEGIYYDFYLMTRSLDHDETQEEIDAE